MADQDRTIGVRADSILCGGVGRMGNVDPMQITLDLHPDIVARFEAVQPEFAATLGFDFALPVQWLMIIALDTTDPAELIKTIRKLSRDYLLNRPGNTALEVTDEVGAFFHDPA